MYYLHFADALFLLYMSEESLFIFRGHLKVILFVNVSWTAPLSIVTLVQQVESYVTIVLHACLSFAVLAQLPHFSALESRKSTASSRDILSLLDKL